eukprot:5878327-Amphidinium_carterae.1
MTTQCVLRGTGLSRLAEDERWIATSVPDLKGLAGHRAGGKDFASSTSSTSTSTSAPETSSRWTCANSTAYQGVPRETRTSTSGRGGPRYMAYRERHRPVEAAEAAGAAQGSRTAGRSSGRKRGSSRRNRTWNL